ncbi:MAG: class I tRNA ligase family protein, partial [Nannocystaceae bacterium]
ATTMGLKILEVVRGEAEGETDIQAEAFSGQGTAVNSGFLDGLETTAAKAKMIAWLEEQGKGRGRITYKLRDWLFSRQRYWGEPFPLIHRPSGEVVAVEELPVELPEMADFQPSATGEPPLAKATQWRELADGSLREVNTMPQWAGSCWYYLRFMDPQNSEAAFSREAADYWLPVDLYVGGAEHAVLHLLYARFWHKVLFDLGHVGTPEPFRKLVNQGMVLGATYYPKDRRKGEDGLPLVFKTNEVEPVAPGSDKMQVQETGEAVDVQWDKMSKSRGNVINPDDVIKQFGADTMRMYEMFMGPLEHSAPWQPEGVAGCSRFLKRVYFLGFVGDKEGEDRPRELPKGDGTEAQQRLVHRTIVEVSERVERMGFNTAISSLMVLVRDIGEISWSGMHILCRLLAPFAPHLAEEIWAKVLGCSEPLAHAPWPEADPKLLVEDTWKMVVQVNGKRRAELEVPTGAAKDELIALAMANPTVIKFVAGKPPRRVIYVKNRLVNVVV